MDQVMLTALRREISAIEGRPAGFDQIGLGISSTAHSRESGNPELMSEQAGFGSRPARVRAEKGGRIELGVEAIDHRLGGGLTLAALHELRCDETRGTGALTGFAAGILSRIGALNDKPILWIEEEMG